MYMQTCQLIKISEQEIVSCDKNDGGCDGGDLPTAFKWAKQNGGIDTQADYPDTSSKTGKDGTCKTLISNMRSHHAQVELALLRRRTI